MPLEQAVKVRPAAAPGLTYAVEAAPAAGTSLEIAPGVRWVSMPLPFPPGHINLWLLADGAGWTVVDCGYGSRPVRELWEAIFARELGGAAVTRVVITHCHPDHMGNAAWMAERFGLLPWMTQSEYLLAHAAYHQAGSSSREAMLALNERHGAARERLAGLQPPSEGYRRGVPELPAAFHRIADGATLTIGGNAWRVLVGHGHSPEHAALYCERLNVLIPGDMLLPRISTHVGVWPMQPDADPVGEFLASIEAFTRLPEDVLVLPSHGLPFRGARARVAALVAHHQERFATLAGACAQPRAAAELLPLLFGREFADYQLFFAMGETIAHLNYLMHRGELERSPAPRHRFQRRAGGAPTRTGS